MKTKYKAITIEQGIDKLFSIFVKDKFIDDLPEGDLLILDCQKVNYLGVTTNLDEIQKSVNLEELVGAFDWARAFHSDDEIILKW